ncbi:restriction endonuclease [Methanogenium marinum]|uniref:Restriction endonuclease n=1 Tax=Methanogenium marinum TaxID=348610 RepID=A0A9Q4KR40_9EURY|nr:restriction endonuclease [Methanogenium marinum]MDE4908795.1 restriction endonuclease [Methanogenium marinum]
MVDYDLECLSPQEFELLICDIFQKKLDATLETFKSGRDKGIDIRGCFKSGTTIIQCKHYFKSSASTLKSHLKKEVKKVEIISPNRYIIAASTELNPNDKSEIKGIFGSYCQNEQDIFGREDILNFLRENEDIVKKHPKLWFTSSTVLEIILNKAIYNQTDIDIENFIDFLPKMVITDEFHEVDEILKEEHVCIISGQPGIGKSTLMKGLVIKYSANGYQPIKISGDFKDAYSLLKRDKKQIFYYDDFLGSTYYTEGPGDNKEKSIESFIMAVKRSKGNTIFILTTRDYVLNQAQQKSDVAERFGHFEHIISFNDAEKKIKAQILYNHLWHSEIEDENINKIIEDKNYLKIISHRNFNPRIIESMTNLTEINRADFVDTFLSVLDNPEEIWNKVYTSSLSDYSRTILVILTILDNNTSKNSVFEYYHEYYHNETDVVKLKREFDLSLKELDGSLITLTKSVLTGDIKIGYKNPSVEDFMNKKIVESDLLLCHLCNLINGIRELEKIWNVFKNQNKVDQIERYPNFIEQYFEANKRIGNKYIDEKDTAKLDKLTIHLVSVSGQINEEKYIEYTNCLLEILLKEVEVDKFYFRRINPLLSILTENKNIFFSSWNDFVSAIKKRLLSKEFTYLSEYIQIVEFSNATGVEIQGNDWDKLISDLDIFIEGGIEIEINQEDREPRYYEYNLKYDCYDHNGSDINDLENIKEEIETIAEFFKIDIDSILGEISSVIDGYYDNCESEPDEDEYKYQNLQDQYLEEEIGIQDLFEGLREKNQ